MGIPVFMEGVPGIIPIFDKTLTQEILEKISKITGWKGKGFPGSVSVPMDNSNIKYLVSEEYMVSHKADGTRYLMWIEGPGKIYFFGRNGDVFQILPKMEFPILFGSTNHLSETLLDGEMILWHNEDTKTKVFKYLIFDIMSIQGKSVVKENLKDRSRYIYEDIIAARDLADKTKKISMKNEPFQIEQVNFYGFFGSGKVLSFVMKQTQSLPYKTDGFVFTPVYRAYNYWPERVGVCDYTLKWKPASLNTVDFILRIRADQNENGIKRIGNLCVTAEDGSEIPFGTIALTAEIENLDGKILEFKKMDANWVLLRERRDKEMPNTLRTTKDTIKSMEDGITEEQLLSYINSGGATLDADIETVREKT